MVVHKTHSRAGTSDHQLMHGVPIASDGKDTVIPRRLTTVAVPTSSLSDGLWERMHGDPLRAPALFVPRHDDAAPVVASGVKPVNAKDVARRVEIAKWIAQKPTQRSWRKWLEIVAEPKDLTSALEALWAKKHTSRVPDEMVLVVDQYSSGEASWVIILAVVPQAEGVVAELHRQYPSRAILSVTRQADSTFAVVAPVAGPTAAEILKVSLKKRDVQVAHSVEKNVAIRVSGTSKVVTGDQTQLLWDVFLGYVRKNAEMLVALFSDIQSTLDAKVEFLPDEFALTALRQGDKVHSIVPMMWEAADKILDRYLVVYFKHLSGTHYVVSRIRGTYAMDLVEALFKGLKIFPNKPLAVEMLLVAGTLTTGHVKDVTARPWKEYLKYVETLGHGLWNRMATIYLATHYHDLGDDETLPNLWLMIDRDQVDNVDYLQRIVVSDREGRSTAAAIQIAPTATGTRIVSLRGTGMLDVALAWVAGVGFKVQNVIEKGFVGGTFGFEIQWRHSKESPTWEGWRQYVQSHGLQGLGQRMRQIYEVVHAGETSPDDLVVIGRRVKKEGVAKFRNLQVLTVEDAAPYLAELNTMKLHIRRLPDGQETLVSATGVGAREIEPLLKPQGSLVLAPDADEMDKQAQTLRPAPEGFALPDADLCKPKPLFTPAEVLKTPSLEQPADVLDLPKLEGFAILDPKDMEKYKIPPSVGRLGSPLPVDEDQVELPEFVGADAFLPEPPLGMVVSGYAILGGVMLAGPAVETVAAIDLGIALPVLGNFLRFAPIHI